MDDQKKDRKQDEAVSRRSFLTSLGKWSSIVVATATIGLSEALGSGAPKEELQEDSDPRLGRESVTSGRDHEAEAEPQWRCRVWGNRGRRYWGHGCRVWGNGCRVWGNW